MFHTHHREAGRLVLCRCAVDGFISRNQLLETFPEPDQCLQLLIPLHSSNISLNESMS